MKKETIPCKECLVLAACKNKTHVYCTLLYKWYADDKKQGKLKVMGRILQKMKRLEGETKTKRAASYFFITVGGEK